MSSHYTLDHPAEADRSLQHALATVDAEDAFDRLNPDFGIAADHYQRQGHQAVQQREAALALGTRTAVALQREEVGPPAWRAGAVAGRARLAERLARTRQHPEWPRPEPFAPERPPARERVAPEPFPARQRLGPERAAPER